MDNSKFWLDLLGQWFRSTLGDQFVQNFERYHASLQIASSGKVKVSHLHFLSWGGLDSIRHFWRAEITFVLMKLTPEFLISAQYLHKTEFTAKVTFINLT